MSRSAVEHEPFYLFIYLFFFKYKINNAHKTKKY